jgi:LysM repeat protein
MFALDLFNTDHERRLAEGAVDRLEQRRIDDLAMRMDDLVARAKKADTPEHKAALVKEFQRCKAERDSYFKIKDECMGYGTLVGEQDLDEGLGDSIKLAWVKALAWLGDKALSISKDPALKDRAKELLAQQTAKIEQMMLNTIAGHPREEELKKLIHYIVTQLNQQQTIGDFMRVLATLGKQFKTEREKFSEAEKNQDIADKEWLKKMGREPQGPLDKSIETAKQAARWVAGKGGPGKEGPTYESRIQKKNLVNSRIDLTESRTYKLWESAGQKIVEYKLTPDQIQQLFQQVEQGATAAGGNRTMIGQGKDVADAVGQAWNDLLGKVQNSGPIKNVDAAYDQVAAKLKQATGGDAGVMKYVEKYRAFAKKHPIAQSLIYAALIGALSISSAGVGGAAALGLLKMTDRLLQGDKFSSAVGKGVVAGALAYGASHLMQYLQNPGTPVPPNTDVKLPDGTDYVVQKGDTLSQIAQKNGISVDDLMKANSGQSIAVGGPTADPAFTQVDSMGNYTGTATDPADIVTRTNITNPDDIKAGQSLFVPTSAGPTPTYQGGVGTAADTWNKVQSGTYTPSQISTNQAIKYGLTGATDSATNAGQAATTAASGAAKGGYDAVQNAATQAAINAQTNPEWDNEIGQRVAGAGNLAGAQSPKGQFPTGLNPRGRGYGLSESAIDRDLTVYTWALNESIGLPRGGVQLTNEGIGSMFKSAASKVGQWAQRTGHNLTTRVTADKLQKAWQKAGSPTDSDEIAAILQTAGVTPEIVNQIYAAMKIPAPKQAGAQPSTPAATDAAQAGAEQPAQTTKKHTGGRVAGAGPSQTPNAIRQRQARAAKKNSTTSAAPATAGAGVFGQMAKDLSTTGTSSTGGMTQATPTGLRHTANPNNPNMAKAATAPTTAPATTAPAVRPNYGAQTGAGAKVTYNQPTNVQYPKVNVPPATKRAPAAQPAEVAEGQMAELDAMRQDLELMSDRQFMAAYGMSKQAFEHRYRTLLKPALDEARLAVGDPVVVTAPNEFEGATGEIYEFSPSGTFVIVNLYNHGKHSMHLSDVAYNDYADKQEEDDWYDDADEFGKPGSEFFPEGSQNFDEKEPYEVCLAGKCVKTFDYFQDARRFHDNWKKKLYAQGEKEKADKITLNPIMREEEQKPAGWGEFPPKQEITIVPPRKLKSGETYQDRNKYWQSQGQAPIYKTNEAGSPAQQAAIAIAMKRASKKPKNVDENTVQIPHKGKMVSGKVVRKDPVSGEYIVDVGDRESVRVPAHKVKHDVEETTAFLTRGPRLSYGTQARHDTLGPVQIERHMPDGSVVVYCERDGKRYRTSPSSLKSAVAETPTDYQKRRQRERDIDAGKPVPKQRQPHMTDYQKKRAQDKKEMELGEESSTSSEAVERAVLNRIMVAHTDLLMKFGPEKVMQAAEEVAYNAGDVDEIGTSDVSAYVNQVKQILGVEA